MRNTLGHSGNVWQADEIYDFKLEKACVVTRDIHKERAFILLLHADYICKESEHLLSLAVRLSLGYRVVVWCSCLTTDSLLLFLARKMPIYPALFFCWYRGVSLICDCVRTMEIRDQAVWKYNQHSVSPLSLVWLHFLCGAHHSRQGQYWRSVNSREGEE